MTVKVTVQDGDYRAFLRVIVRTVMRRGASLSLIGFLIALTIGIGIGMLARAGLPELHLPSLMLGIVGGVAWVMIRSQVAANRLAPSPDGIMLGPQEYTITEPGIEVKSQRHEVLYNWQTVRGVEITKEHVFIFVDSIAALILPRRDFTSEAETDEFVSQVQRRCINKNSQS